MGRLNPVCWDFLGKPIDSFHEDGINLCQPARWGGMRVLLALAVLVFGAASATGLTAVSGQEPTPTATPTPTPAPTPTPVPTSTITIRFVRKGQPVEVLTTAPTIIANGVVCLVPIIPEPEKRSSYTVVWPGFPPGECQKAPPTSIRFEFSTNFGLLSVEVMWTGVDVTVDMEVPSAPTPAATPASTASPVQRLPTTGAVPGDGGSSGIAWIFVQVVGGCITAIALATLLEQRR